MSKAFFLVFILFSLFHISAQDKIGININPPQFTLDIRSPNTSDPGELNIGNSDNSRFLKLFGGSNTSTDPRIIWSQNQKLLIGTDASGFTERMRIASNGNIGINNTNPQYELDAAGQNSNEAGEINVRMTTNASYLRLNSGREADPIPKIMWTEGKELLFATDDATFGYVGRMNITGDGKVGIGVYSPAAKLDVDGKIKLGDDLTSDAPGQIRWNSTDKSFEGYDGTNWLPLGKSKSKTIGFSEFQSSATGDKILRDVSNPVGAYIDDGGTFKSSNYVIIPLTFDVGTSVDSIKIMYYDNDASRNIRIAIVRIFENSTGAGLGPAVTSSGTSSSNQILDYTSSVYFNDLMQTFFIAYPVVDGTGSTTDWGPGDIKIRSITVYYH